MRAKIRPQVVGAFSKLGQILLEKQVVATFPCPAPMSPAQAGYGRDSTGELRNKHLVAEKTPFDEDRQLA